MSIFFDKNLNGFPVNYSKPIAVQKPVVDIYLKYFILVLMKSINFSLLSPLSPFISIRLVINVCSVLCSTLPFR